MSYLWRLSSPRWQWYIQQNQRKWIEKYENRGWVGDGRVGGGGFGGGGGVGVGVGIVTNTIIIVYISEIEYILNTLFNKIFFILSPLLIK